MVLQVQGEIDRSHATAAEFALDRVAPVEGGLERRPRVVHGRLEASHDRGRNLTRPEAPHSRRHATLAALVLGPYAWRGPRLEAARGALPRSLPTLDDHPAAASTGRCPALVWRRGAVAVDLQGGRRMVLPRRRVGRQ